MTAKIPMLTGLLFLIWASSACSHHSPPAQAPVGLEAQSRYLFVEGLQLLRAGQSLKAEQYLLAAWDAGAPSEQVLGPLVESCVSDGRLRSAVFHVERARKALPEDPNLMHLAASLYLALGQAQRAEQEVAALAASAPDYPEGVYFLGEYYYLQGSYQQAQPYFERFLAKWPRAEQAPWVRHLLAQALVQEPRSAEAGTAKVEVSHERFD